ncbi:MAG: orotate phosphoribosyltransferase [Rhodospirillales bacterium]
MAEAEVKAGGEIHGADAETARILLRIGAVEFRPDRPFRFTSGWASPVYIDCRRLISFVPERRHVVDRAVALLDDRIGRAAIDAVAGGETAGIPYAAWMADAMARPMLYVRKQPKGFGRNARIEGDFGDGARVLLVEDLATDGASKLAFAAALRDAGAVVEHAFVVFFYGIFPGARDALAGAGLSLHFLATWWDVVAAAEAGGHFPADSIAEVRRFLADPVGWSAAHGGRDRP